MKLSSKRYIGIDLKPIEVPRRHEVISEDKYTTFEIKRLTKANSFTVCGEVYHIGKKTPDGKASSIYHVTRVSDMRYVCPSTLDKDETIKMVQRKIFELDLCREGSTLF